MTGTSNNKLKAALAVRGMSIVGLSKATGIKAERMYLSVQGKREFRIGEVKLISKALGLKSKERDAIFYD